MGVLATFVDVVPCLLPACAAPVLVTERRKVLVLCCRAVLTCACVWAVWRLCAVAVAVEVAVVAVAVALMATPPTVVASTTTTSAAVAVAVTSSRLPAKTGTRTWTLCRGGLTSSRQGGWFASQMRSPGNTCVSRQRVQHDRPVVGRHPSLACAAQYWVYI